MGANIIRKMIFPKNPTIGQIYNPHHGKISYQWNSFAWEKYKPSDKEPDSSWYRNLSTDINKEMPEGSADGYNFIFNLMYTPIKGSENIYLNGLLQKAGEDFDYTIIDKTIYFNEPPFERSSVLCTYSINYKTEIRNEIPEGKIDGYNSVFYLKNKPDEKTEHIFLNGLLQNIGGNSDYILENNIIKFNYPPVEKSSITVNYVTSK